MKRASTGWPIGRPKTSLRPARGYIKITGEKGQPRFVRAPMRGWRERRAISNADACLSGYGVKAKMIEHGFGTHRAVCNPRLDPSF